MHTALLNRYPLTYCTDGYGVRIFLTIKYEIEVHVLEGLVANVRGRTHLLTLCTSR